ncbi:MAG: hypothetical protein OXB86_06160, partial [Bdellovibrionales bacterium]|nr:hypothetical protein [Bdellovibrionales bacterium]
TRSKSSKNELKLLSQWVYDELFKEGNPPLHILLRDYARGVIEVAFHRGVKLTFDRKKIEPPFNSDWPETVPSEKILKTKYYPKIQKSGIWSSIMYNTDMLGDFGNYVINSNVDNWCGRRLNIKKADRKSLFDNFKSKLTEEQEELFRKDSRIFHDVNILRILFGDKSNSLSKKKKENKLTFSDFENSLSSKKRIFFKKEIKPFLDRDGSINNSLEKFDTGLAQRWVLNRVMQLGWQQALHEKFDRDINYYSISRAENKPERIGKKYQWIALYELLAMISDNFEFKDEMQSGKVGKYEGPWQITIRDIDPSCTLKGVADEERNIPSFNKYEIQKLHSNWNKSVTNSIWLKQQKDLPNPKKIIEFTDDQKNIWVALEGFVEWQEETPPENEKYSLPTRTLWYMLKSYLVRVKDKDKVFKWAEQQNFMGRWMPESSEFYTIYLGEYPWAPAFHYHYTPYYHHDGWTSQGQQIPTEVLVTDDYYLNSSSSRDYSTDEAIRIKLPAKLIVDEMSLIQNHIDGRFFDKNDDLVVFDPSIFHSNMHQQVLIRKDKLLNFLKHKGYALFWTLIGEKNVIGIEVDRKNLSGRLEISGAYTLDNKNKITGGYKIF